MSVATTLYRFLLRAGTAAALAALNEIPKARELIAATDARNFKLGDGSTAFNSLPWLLVPWVAASGTNTITATYTDKPVLFDGMQVRFRAAGANTGAVTFNPNSLGALAVTKLGGSALSGGEIRAAGQEVRLVYRSSVPRWEIANPAFLAADIPIVDVAGGYTATDVEAALAEARALIAAIGGGSSTISATVSGSAATSLTLSGLSLDFDESYDITIGVKNATASAANVSATFNADTTATNYDSQVDIFSNNTTSGGRANTARSFDLAAATGAPATLYGTLTKGAGGKAILTLTGTDNTTTNIRAWLSVVIWRTTGSNVTDITLTSSVASSLDVGSYIKARKRHP